MDSAWTGGAEGSRGEGGQEVDAPPVQACGPPTIQAAFGPETDPKSQDWGLREPRGRGASPTLCPHPCRWEVAV